MSEVLTDGPANWLQTPASPQTITELKVWEVGESLGCPDTIQRHSDYVLGHDWLWGQEH